MPIRVKGYRRFDPRAGRIVKVGPYTRMQKVRDYSYFSRVIQKQESEDDWSHFSINYSNIIGLTDEEIETFIKNTEEPNRELVKEYIKHIKCYNQDDIREVSKKAFEEFDTIMRDKEMSGKLSPENKYLTTRTIFITSPRGGFNILSDFGYANKLSKEYFPYDFERSTFYDTPTLKSESLPYGKHIEDVNDIVFIDDIYMSGEQCERAYSELRDKIKELNIPDEQKPRLHYITIAGNKHESRGRHNWNTFTIGNEFSFKRDGKKFEEVSAVVFPFSIPDGVRHDIARKIYRSKKRFEHRKY